MKNSLSKTHITSPSPAFRRNVLILLFFLTQIPLHLYAQNQKIKKEIVIRNTVNYYGNSIIDTSHIAYYDINGICDSTLYPYGDGSASFGRIIGDAKRSTIDSTADKIHYGVLRTDSAYWDEYKTIYKDSMVFYTIEDNDTIRKRVTFIKGEKTYRIVETNKNKMLSKSDTSYYQTYWDCTFERNNKLYAKAFVIRNEDTTKETKNKVFHISKVFRYYSDKNKWSLDIKEKKDRKGYRVKEINFMSGEKTKTKFKYNSSGKLTSEISRNHSGKTKKIYTYIYEYYETD
jgi:hypothetical protein